jgi:hypothetical protein
MTANIVLFISALLLILVAIAGIVISIAMIFILRKKEVPQSENQEETTKTTQLATTDTKKTWKSTLLLLLLSTANLAGGAAILLGFRGILAPFKAAFNPAIGMIIWLFIIGMLFLIIIYLRKGFNWDTCKAWVIGMNTVLAILAFIIVWYPLLISKAKLRANASNVASARIEQRIGSYLVPKAELLVYREVAWYKKAANAFTGSASLVPFKVNNIQKKLLATTGKQYDIVDIKNVRQIGKYKLVPVYLEDETVNLDGNEIGWVRIDNPNKAKIIAKTDLYPLLPSSPAPGGENALSQLPVKIYEPNSDPEVPYIFPFTQAGMRMDHWIGSPEGMDMLDEIFSTNDNFKVYLRQSGKIIDYSKGQKIPKNAYEDDMLIESLGPVRVMLCREKTVI